MRRTQQVTLLAVLACVMVVVYARAFKKRGSPEAGRKSLVQGRQAPDTATEASPAGAAVSLLPPPSTQRDAQRTRATRLSWRRDPFLRGGTIGELSGLALSGILWDPKEPMAIINGQMVHVGEELDGYRVVEIMQDKVSITDGDQTFQLVLTP